MILVSVVLSQYACVTDDDRQVKHQTNYMQCTCNDQLTTVSKVVTTGMQADTESSLATSSALMAAHITDVFGDRIAVHVMLCNIVIDDLRCRAMTSAYW